MPAPSDLVHQTTTSTGIGNLTVAAVNGKRSFSTAFGTGTTTNVFDYFVSSQTAAEWERGTGHMSNATTLVRDTVLASSNAGAAVNFTAGLKDVTNDVPAGKQFTTEGGTVAGPVAISNTTPSTSTTTGALTVGTGGAGIQGALNVGGGLNVSGGRIVMNDLSSSDNFLDYKDNGVYRWSFGYLGASSGGPTAYDGQDMRLYAVRNDGAGNYLALQIIRATGQMICGPLSVNGEMSVAVAASATPLAIGQMMFQATSNTQLTIKYKGSDGVVRSANLTLT
jgi:hypothetical protein